MALGVAAAVLTASASGCVVLGFGCDQVAESAATAAQLESLELRVSALEESLGKPAIVQDSAMPVLEDGPDAPDDEGGENLPVGQ